MLVFIPIFLHAQGLNIPTKHYGLSIGNSKHFTGVRINWSERNVEKVTGLNFTLWRAKENKKAVVKVFHWD